MIGHRMGTLVHRSFLLWRFISSWRGTWGCASQTQHTKLTPGWALIWVNFEPMWEIQPKVGGERSFMSGCSLPSLWYHAGRTARKDSCSVCTYYIKIVVVLSFHCFSDEVVVKLISSFFEQNTKEMQHSFRKSTVILNKIMWIVQNAFSLGRREWAYSA